MILYARFFCICCQEFNDRTNYTQCNNVLHCVNACLNQWKFVRSCRFRLLTKKGNSYIIQPFKYILKCTTVFRIKPWFKHGTYKIWAFHFNPNTMIPNYAISITYITTSYNISLLNLHENAKINWTSMTNKVFKIQINL